MIAESPLLRAKLYIPPPRVGQVARPRLVQRLDEVLETGRRLAVVSAPAGYGKSTLLAEWVRGAPGPVGWLSVDEDDNDPARFLPHLIAALRNVRPGAGEAALARLRGPQGARDLKPVLNSLANDLPPRDGPPGVLVLDDCHLIAAEASHELIAFLLDRLPADLRLVAAGRVEPPLPLARLRARGQLVELGLADLAFTISEAAGFLSEAMGLELADAQVRALEGRTEGWAAGLQLAALALHAAPDAQALIQTLSGSHRYISDYLVAEVLELQPEPVRQFLLHTSVLERMAAGLCAGLMGVSEAEAQARLDELDQARLFLIPLDGERRWYRYHHLFGEALREQLRRTQPDVEPALRRRAATWFAGQDLLDEAIHHALAARDYDSAAAWIDIASDQMIRLGQLRTIRNWLEALPGAVVRGDPALCVWQCWTLLDADRLAELEPFLQAAEAALQMPGRFASGENRSQLAGQLAVIRSQRAYRQGQPEEGMHFAREALRTLSPLQVSLRSFVGLNLGDRYLRLGEADAADVPLSEAHNAMRAVHHPFIRLQIAESLAELRWLQGRLRAAAEVSREALKLVGQHGLDSLAAGLHERLGLVYLEWHALDQAAQQAEAMARVTRRNNDAAGEAQAGLLGARILQARGEGAAAEEAINEACRQLAPLNDEYLDRWLGAWLARFWLTAGQVERARAALEQASGRASRTEFEAQLLARVRLAEGHAPEALALVKRVRAVAEQAGRHGPALRARVTQALAHEAQGQSSQALRVLEGALRAAAPEGFVRIFLDDGAPAVRLLGRLSQAHPQRGYADRLLQLAGAGEAASAVEIAPSVPGAVEPLTGREREVLQLLAAGLSNQEIAVRLVVAVDTVRWYSKQIYRKLAVHNRTQAVLRAQALGLA